MKLLGMEVSLYAGRLVWLEVYEDFYNAATLTVLQLQQFRFNFSLNLNEQGKTCGFKSAILLLIFLLILQFQIVIF